MIDVRKIPVQARLTEDDFALLDPAWAHTCRLAYTRLLAYRVLPTAPVSRASPARDATTGAQEEAMARSLVEQQMETTARTYFDRVTAGDVEGILALFADDAHVLHPLSSAAGIRGKAALRAAYEEVFRTLVAYYAQPTAIIIEGNTLVAPLHFEGTTTDGQRLVMDNLNFWTFEDGKFKVLRVYMDTYPYRQALSQALGSGNP